jgi:hypothetical protein
MNGNSGNNTKCFPSDPDASKYITIGSIYSRHNALTRYSFTSP